MSLGLADQLLESTECATIRSLRALGFASRETDPNRTKISYDMGGWALTALQCANQYFSPIVQIGGVLHTGRTLHDVGFQMPQTLNEPKEAAAYLVFSLRDIEHELRHRPLWWDVGLANLHRHPIYQKQEQHKRYMKAFAARPHCVIDVEHARVFRRQLRQAIEDLHSDVVARLTFDGQVLRIDLSGRTVAVLATGDPWPHSVSWPLSNTTQLPGRFSGESVTIGFFDGTVDFARDRYHGASEC